MGENKLPLYKEKTWRNLCLIIIPHRGGEGEMKNSRHPYGEGGV